MGRRFLNINGGMSCCRGIGVCCFKKLIRTGAIAARDDVGSTILALIVTMDKNQYAFVCTI
jgi:hypothetical protein